MNLKQAQDISYAVIKARCSARMNPENPTFGKLDFPSVSEFDG